MFDYVIVGAGSAGCVLANRLSADPGVKVLLLEAGDGAHSLDVTIPAQYPKQFGTARDWRFMTEPEPYVDDRRLYVPRGRGLGGSSAMNAMLWVRGHRADYDSWAQQGAAGWSYDEVLPYFKRIEAHPGGDTELRGGSGPMRIARQRSPRPISLQLIESAVAAGMPHDEAYNESCHEGVALFEVTQSRGRRWSAADGYLRPVMGRPNLEVRTGVLVLAIELDGDRAVGVRIATESGSEVVPASREVVLSAGSIGSPHLLQLSGIGPVADLEAAGVQVRHELAGVGANLQDHPMISAAWQVEDASTRKQDANRRYLADWILRRRGPLTSPIAEVCGFLRTPGASDELGLPDIQLHMGGAYVDDAGIARFDGNAAMIGSVLLRPQARGKVWLRSADPADRPRILTNTLSEQADRDSMVAAIEVSREIAAQAPFSEIVKREVRPGGKRTSRQDIEADLRKRVMLLYHPSCTCKMSDTAVDAVVDSQLRVHGIDGLRVVDASVMPTVTGGNTHAPVLMIAERAADLLLGRSLV